MRVKAFILCACLIQASAFAQKTERDIAYGRDPAQKLDLSVPAGSHFATIIFVHGGSLNSGDKADSDYGKVCEPIVGQSIACANVNYRLAPKFDWPAQGEDVASAIAWVHSNVGVRGGDARRIFLLGHSSGATLVALIGSDEKYLARVGMKLNEIRGVIPMGSIMEDLELQQSIKKHGESVVRAHFMDDDSNRVFGTLDAYQDHWPLRHVHKGLPPYLFLVAEAEKENPPVLETDERFAAATKRLGGKAEVKVLGGRKHYTAIRLLGTKDDLALKYMVEFVRDNSR